MIRAGIVPLQGGYCGIVVAASDSPPLALLHAESFEVGHRVAKEPESPLDVSVPKREITEDDRKTLTARVLTILKNNGAEEVILEEPGPKAALALSVAKALEDAIIGAGIGIARVSPIARAGQLLPGKELADRIDVKGCFDKWPDRTFQVIELAAALIVRELDGKDLEKAKPAPAKVKTEGGAPVARPPSPAPIVIRGPCTAAIDPGSHYLGLIIATKEGQIVHHATLQVGHEKPLAKPRVTKLADGTERTRKFKRVIEPDDLVALAETVRDLLQKYKVDLVLLEWIRDARGGGKSNAIANSRATETARQQWVGGMLHGMIMMLNLGVSLVSWQEWSAAVTGSRIQKGRRGIVAKVIESRWPELSGADEHQRDAAGLLAFELMPEKPQKRKAAESAGPKRKRGFNENRARGAADYRASKGCTCASTRHRKTCPLFVPKANSRSHKWPRKQADA